MKIWLAIAAFLIGVQPVQAVGIGGGVVAGHPEYDYAWFTLDGNFDFYHPPYMWVTSGTLYMGPGADNFTHYGMRVPYIAYNSSTIPCDAGNGGVLKKSDTNNDMMWCDGDDWVDVTTTLGGAVATANSVSDSLPSYTLLSTYASGISSLTTAVNGKASVASVSALDASVTSALGGYTPLATYTSGLATKADVSHSHTINQVLGLQAQLDAISATAASRVSVSTLSGYVTTGTYNAGVASLTSAVNDKVGIGTYTTQVASLTSAINTKQASLGTSNTGTYLRGDQTWQTLPVGTTLYSNTTVLSAPRIVLKSGSTSGGQVVFQLTTDNTSSGTAIFNTIGGVDVDVNAAGNAFPTSWALSNSNRTLTVTVNQTGSLLGLGLVPFVSAANGIPVNVRVFGN